MLEVVGIIPSDPAEESIEKELEGNDLIPSWFEVAHKFNLLEILTPPEFLTFVYFNVSIR